MANAEHDWPIDWIDRSIAELDNNYRTVLGDDYSLMQAAYDLGVRAQEADRPLRILDIGCGTGRPLHGLSLNTCRGLPSCAIQAVGVNFEDFTGRSRSKSVRSAITNGTIQYVLGDAAKLPLRDAGFDLVYEHEMLVHSDGDETVKRFHEMARVLAPGGRMYLGLFNQPQLAGPLRKLKRQGYTIEGNAWSGHSPSTAIVGQIVSRTIFCIDRPLDSR